MKKTKVRRTSRFPRIFNRHCKLCKENIENIDYKETDKLQEFISKKGKLLSRRINGNCAKHQKRIAQSIKRARYMALLPYIT